MFTALKLGFRYSTTIRSFSAANYRIPKFAGNFVVNLKMGSESFCSSSPEIAKPRKISVKVSSRKGRNAVDECEEEVDDMTTLGQMKSRLSRGIAANGSKNALVSNLKSDKNNEDSSAQYEVMDEKTPADVKTYSRRKAKVLPEIDDVQAINKDADMSGVKTKKRRVKISSSDATDIQTLQRTSEQELIVEAVESKGGKSTRTKRKVSSTRITTSTEVSTNVGPLVEEPWTVLTHKKPQKGWIAYNPKTMRPPPIDTSTKSIKLVSWNVNGLRALLKLEFSVLQLAQRENFDVLCLQETKLQEKDIDAIREILLDGYDYSYWSCSVSKLGYSGTAIISRIKPLSVRYGLGIPDHDAEGRVVTVEFDNFYLLSAYVPNSSDGLKRLPYRITEWDPSLSSYMKDLERSKPVILTGDLNCAHQEIDIYNPAGNKRSAGFTIEERESFQKNYLDNGFVDTFRKQHPDTVGYTYWGYRHFGRKTNKGWRLDYFLVSESIADKVYDSYILPDIGGSDHGPIGLILRL